ncbi:MAG: DNA polymerase III subunit beta [Candidatus Kerfeldbacteria bacterium]|nr:DNA polymerase III subunit beta [Candidatus Kerfeldbacteria bacterium]
MKCTVTQENLTQALSVVSRIASKSTNLPILSNVLFRARKSGITLLATNLEIGITHRVRGRVEGEGVFTLPAKIFSDYISLLEQEKVALAQEGEDIRITTESSETVLRGLAADEFPLIPDVDRSKGFACSADDLKNGIAQVLFAAAYDDARPEISGVYLQFSKKELILAATDSYRLAERKVVLQDGGDEPAAVIVPARALQELLRILSQPGDRVQVFVTQNQILFVYEETELVSRLIDGQYPDYQQIIPKQHATALRAKSSELLRAVRATSLFGRPGINDLHMMLQPKEQRLLLKASNTQVGENTQSLHVAIEGDENSIVFNSKYLLDGIANIGSQEVIFEMTNNASPGVLRPTESGAYLYIIMPIKQ